MFCISIALADNPVTWTLLYKTRESAEGSRNCFKLCGKNDTVNLVDDFGQEAVIERPRVAGMLFEDLDQSMLAHIERGLHNARTQAKAESIAMNDPVLKAAAMAKQRGPGIVSPMGNGAHF